MRKQENYGKQERYPVEHYKKTLTTGISIDFPKVHNQGSGGIPGIIQNEINNCLKDIENNKSLGDDEIYTDNVKLRGAAFLNVLY